MTASGIPVDRLPTEPRRVRADVGWWGMVLFCMTEATLFAYFLGSYFYLGVANPAWPPAGVPDPSLRLPLLMTLLLVSSSVVLVLGERRLARGQRAHYHLGTALTVLLGLGFLALQAAEYREKLAHGGPATSAYDSLFFTITGFHGTHVFVGLLLLTWTLARSLAGNIDPARPVAVKNASLYWHFVDAVWLVIFTCLYLSPRWY